MKAEETLMKRYGVAIDSLGRISRQSHAPGTGYA